MNRVHIIGYQTQPVNVRQTPNGTSVTDLNLVVPYTYLSEGGQTMFGKSFFTVTVWGSMADVAGQFVRPGSELFVSGRLQTESWEDQSTKEKRSKTKVVGLDLILLDPKDGQLPELPAGSPLSGGVNHAEIVGNVTRDPEMRITTSGQQVLTLGVATNERWKDKSTGENRERAEFHSVVVWGALADAVHKSLKKGSRVYVSGRVQTRSFETKTGSKRTTTEIIAEAVRLLGLESSVAAEAISMAAASPRGSRRGASPEAESELAAASVSAGAPDIVPEIAYESEVKAEDLPF